MSNGRRPKLEIPSSTLRNAEQNAVRVTLKYDDPLEKQGEYGTYWMYTMMHDGEEHVLFANRGLHQAINETDARTGDTLSIVRLGEGKNAVWDVELERLPASPQGSRSTQAAARPPGKTQATNRPSFADERNRYLAALELARSDMEELGLPFTVDLNAVAFTYWKMANDTGHELNADPPTDAGDSHQEKVDQLRITLGKAFRTSGLDEGKWMEFLATVQGEPVITWSDVNMETGKAAFAWAKNVKDGGMTWDQVFNAIKPKEPNPPEEPELDEHGFPKDVPW